MSEISDYFRKSFGDRIPIKLCIGNLCPTESSIIIESIQFLCCAHNHYYISVISKHRVLPPFKMHGRFLSFEPMPLPYSIALMTVHCDGISIPSLHITKAQTDRTLYRPEILPLWIEPSRRQSLMQVRLQQPKMCTIGPSAVCRTTTGQSYSVPLHQRLA